MTKRQAIAWATRFRDHPPIATAIWRDDGDGDYSVVVTDRLGNTAAFDDRCHAGSILAIWRSQYREAVGR